MDQLEENDEQTDNSTIYVHTETVRTTEIICHSVTKRNTHPEQGHASTSKVSQNLVAPMRGFKHYGDRMRLHCRTGYTLSILPNGIVVGDEYGSDNSGVLEFTSAGIGEVRIRAVHSNLYLAMNKHGILYGEENPRDYATVFIEGIYGQYNTYLSQKYAHNGWYVGIKKNGTIKKGSQTRWGQKAIQFLPIRVDT